MATPRGDRKPPGKRKQKPEASPHREPDSEDDIFEAQLEKILPSNGDRPGPPKSSDTAKVRFAAQAAGQGRGVVRKMSGAQAAGQGEAAAVQKISVEHHTRKLRAAVQVRMSMGGTSISAARRKTRVKPKSATTQQSIFEAMEQQQNKRQCGLFWSCWLYAFNPTEGFKLTWDALMLLLVVYSSFAVPYKTAFKLLGGQWSWDYPSCGMSWDDQCMSYDEWAVDAMFYLDIILNFWTGFDTGYMIDTRKGKIALHYLKSRFPVDCLATVQWDLIVRLSVCGSAGCTGDLRSLNDYASLMRMFKVLRLARAGPLLANLTAHTTVHSVYVDAGTFFLYVLVVGHVLACFFYMIPILFPESCKDPHEYVESAWNTNYTCMPTSWRTNYGLNDENNVHLMPEGSRYLSALYWSLTTMTTIGYGDRGPGNDPEIKFTLLSEIVGLCFFVLLLQEITNVYDESRRQGKETNAVKNEIVQFVKRSVPSSTSFESGTKYRLIDKIVGFLRFKATSSSSREFDVKSSPNFAALSEALQEEIKVAVFRPMLMEVRFFGWCSDDKKDEANVKAMFRAVDSDHSGMITDSEVRQLMLDHFHIKMSDAELSAAIEKMDTAASNKDSNGEVQIELEDFQQWWYLQKHGRPKIGPCPHEMLEWFALRLRSECASPCDRIVRKGEYGDRVFILTGGSVEICDHALRPAPDQQDSHSNSEFENVPSSFGRILRRVQMHSPDRVFGLLAVLNEPDMPAQREFRDIRRQTHQVAVYAGSGAADYTEVLYFTGDDVLTALKRHYHHDNWNVGEYGEPLRYWQEVARNLYCKLYWFDRADAYEWGSHKAGAVEEHGEKLAEAASKNEEPSGQKKKKAPQKGASPPGRAGQGTGPTKVAKAAGALANMVPKNGASGSGGAGGKQRVESWQDRIVEEQVLMERKVSLLDQKVDDIVRQQRVMMEKIDSIANFLSQDLLR